MSSQTDIPGWGTSDYWMWIKERYLSCEPRQFGAVMSEKAEYGRAYVLARRAGLQPADAWEVAQEYCLAIFRAKSNYHPEGRINGFFNTILSRGILAFKRQLARRDRLALFLPLDADSTTHRSDQVPARDGTPLEEAISEDELARIRACMGSLRSTDSEVLTLRYVDELTTEQIAELLGIAEGTVHTRLSRARSRLHALLDRSDT
jgi:RNA polymerase sigma-70 factor (ECF subfamily)